MQAIQSTNRSIVSGAYICLSKCIKACGGSLFVLIEFLPLMAQGSCTAETGKFWTSMRRGDKKSVGVNNHDFEIQSFLYCCIYLFFSITPCKSKSIFIWYIYTYHTKAAISASIVRSYYHLSSSPSMIDNSWRSIYTYNPMPQSITTPSLSTIISSLLSAFDSSRQLYHRIRNKTQQSKSKLNKRGNSTQCSNTVAQAESQAIEEQILQLHLQRAPRQIAKIYATNSGRLGERYRHGDGMCISLLYYDLDMPVFFRSWHLSCYAIIHKSMISKYWGIK